jgi:penicillin-binding protein 1C
VKKLRERIDARRALRTSAAVVLAAFAWLLVGAAMTPLPDALRPGGAPGRYGASIRFVDREGELLREVRADDDKARAVWVPLADVGDNVTSAVLAAEDKRFTLHLGVDPLACVRAAVTSIAKRRVVSGASTLTMQLARVTVPHPRTFRGKLGEMAMAVRIEASLPKAAILEQYLNRAPFGEGVRGIGAASRLYFDKPPRDLSLAEAATLAALPRGPAYYSMTRHPDRVVRRRDRILARMRDMGAISEDDRARASSEPLTLQMGKGGFGAPHLVEALLSGSLDPAVPALRGRTARVETTIDRTLQREVEIAARDVLRPLGRRRVTAASVLVVDNATGEVLAYVGSPKWDDEAHGGHNDGVRARRQPGSTLKPFLYGLAMEDLGWTPATLLADVETHLATRGGDYAPHNYDERFHGPVRLREALGSSLNVPAVQTAAEVGEGRVLERLRAVGLETLQEDASYYGPGLALGDGEVRLWDLVGAYASIARGGTYKPLRAVRRAGDVPLPASWSEEHRVMTEASAAMITDVLRDRASRVAGFGEHTVLDLPFEVAAKTGTSKGYRDNWTLGFTREVTVGVWVGNFDGSPMQNVSGITGAGPLFRAAVAAAMRRREAAAVGFDAPPGLQQVTVCALSGGAPGAGCKHTVHEWVPKGHRVEPCTMHEVVRIDRRNGLRATPSCPASVVALRTFERFDGPFAAWAHASGADRAAAPSEWSPLCAGGPGAGSSAGAGVAIRYPHDGARFVLDPDRPLRAQAIPLKVDVSHAGAVALYVDGRLAGRASGGEPVYWPLTPGAHAIVAEAGGERSDSVSIRVE